MLPRVIKNFGIVAFQAFYDTQPYFVLQYVCVLNNTTYIAIGGLKIKNVPRQLADRP